MKIFLRCLQDFLAMLTRENVSDTAIRFFEMRLLKIAGFEPISHGLRAL